MASITACRNSNLASLISDRVSSPRSFIGRVLYLGLREPVALQVGVCGLGLVAATPREV